MAKICHYRIGVAKYPGVEVLCIKISTPFLYCRARESRGKYPFPVRVVQTDADRRRPGKHYPRFLLLQPEFYIAGRHPSIQSTGYICR